MFDLALTVLTLLMIGTYVVLIAATEQPCLLSRSREDRKAYVAGRRNKLIILLILTVVVIGLTVSKLNSG